MDQDLDFTKNDKVVPNIKIRDLITSVTGGAFGRAGISLDFIDGLTKALTAEGDISRHRKRRGGRC